LRNVGGQPLKRLPNTRDCALAAGELLDRLQIVEGSDTGKAVPGINQPGDRPIVGEFGQFFCIRALSFDGVDGKSGCAVMLFSESMVKVAIATPSITLFKSKGKRKLLPDLEE